MATIRKIVSLTDPEYFCNKSWTLSFSFVTNSWISFHSYLPNWYIGENNFFYSGIKTCCDFPIDFSFIAGPIIPNPPTTTSTTTQAITTTTTSTTIDCSMSGGVIDILDCSIEGTGVIVIPPTPPPCQRPLNMTTDYFATGYTVDPNPPVVTTASSANACAGITYITNNSDYSIQNINVQYVDLTIGRVVFSGVGTSCDYIPDGWYYTEQSSAVGITYHVVGGVITETVSCFPPTTSTTTTCALYLYTVEFYICGTCTFTGTGTIGNSQPLVADKFYFDPVTGFKMKVVCATGCGTGTDRSILTSSAKDSCPAVVCI